ncbi:hypothetical protein ACQ4M4_10335 [Leptolyngbya sp. AN02str]|uniref:hypothetical protein n=1 Tax=Leptolyngbya sp. AN02str TaxID=3423363 RepID=UPI003D31CDBD
MKANLQFQRSSSFSDRRELLKLRTPAPKKWQQYLDRAICFLSGNREPVIRRTYAKTGEMLWIVTDPASSQSQTFCSETEVRVWLEQRYRA